MYTNLDNEFIKILDDLGLKETDISSFNSLKYIKDREERLLAIRKFFNTPEIFDKVKQMYEPSFLASSYYIFTCYNKLEQ
jgi:hypothetical protein